MKLQSFCKKCGAILFQAVVLFALSISVDTFVVGFNSMNQHVEVAEVSQV
jgi:hypothetical protein